MYLTGVPCTNISPINKFLSVIGYHFLTMSLICVTHISTIYDFLLILCEDIKGEERHLLFFKSSFERATLH